MAHDHQHADRTSYFLEQFCTIGVCGILGGVAIMMYRGGMLNYILHPAFHGAVFWGGTALLILIVIRALAIWFEARRPVVDVETHQHHESHGHEGGDDHPHEHSHEHDCGHDHSHDAATEDDHGHDHSWSAWRYALLLLPIVLYFLNLPNRGFSSNWVEKQGQMVLSSAEQQQLESKDPTTVRHLEFKELEQAALSEELRQDFEGRLGKLKGQFMPTKVSDRLFTLVRYRITCCAADAVPVNVAIVAPEAVRLPADQWVEVTGQIQFRKRPDRAEFVPVLQLRSLNDIVPIPEERNLYLQ